MDEQLLDCVGLRCPMPIVKISLVLKSMPLGHRLRVRANDPAFRVDLEAWVKRAGCRLIEYKDGSVQEAVIEKAVGP